jgi:hypothetical protein
MRLFGCVDQPGQLPLTVHVEKKNRLISLPRPIVGCVVLFVTAAAMAAPTVEPAILMAFLYVPSTLLSTPL